VEFLQLRLRLPGEGFCFLLRCLGATPIFYLFDDLVGLVEGTLMLDGIREQGNNDPERAETDYGDHNSGKYIRPVDRLEAAAAVAALGGLVRNVIAEAMAAGLHKAIPFL
jgi:hypothetical protein